MFNFSFFGKSKRFLGIDIGTSSIKVVELSHSKKGTVLENYGERVNKFNEKELDVITNKKAFLASDQKIANSVREILKETKIVAKEAIFSIPDFMSFFTVFNTPPIPKEEIDSVVRFEAKQHIPLPLQEMTLDWSIIKDNTEKENNKNGLKILLVAVPNETILKYQKIAEMAGIKFSIIEAEVFSLTRAVVKKNDLPKTIQIIDIGIQSATITMVKGGLVRSTYSIDFSIVDIIKELAVGLDVDYNKAEELIKLEGFNNQRVGLILQSQVNNLILESKKVSDSYFKQEKKNTEKIIISGGVAQIPGLLEHFSQKVKEETEIANPFVSIAHPPLLNDVIKEMGPRYSIAVGLALRNIKNNKNN